MPTGQHGLIPSLPAPATRAGLPAPHWGHYHDLYRHKGQEILIMADISKESNDCLKALLSLRPWLHQLDIKYGLFEQARM
ncbi:hypothetical protein NDU88_002204 [Pleurodeles waltl]|uniref:Uncharacterized protein n=1 Tax=Pleurodeles waltl TaxID=8319 RepID=A0AAV7NME5_PLEWA|nr:hypothetical protein NDU88_002197 [Pleurodeles waltl]KAJ1113960.1 hypothetical protein NDU88_002200 [Pleurodeles waltl]KAJ1113964.1 hypothetical protein NDU88_002204 [Pleurodeles waltl]